MFEYSEKKTSAGGMIPTQNDICSFLSTDVTDPIIGNDVPFQL